MILILICFVVISLWLSCGLIGLFIASEQQIKQLEKQIGLLREANKNLRYELNSQPSSFNYLGETK